MSDTIVQSTLFAAVFDDGALLNGTWITTYNSADQIVAVTARFTIFYDGQSTTFATPIINQHANPYAPTGAYEIHLTTWSGGLFNSLYVDWTGELPTTLTIGTTEPHYLFTSVALNTDPQPIGLSDNTGTVTSAVVCYCAGTRLRTPDGERAVEDLAVGQAILSASGAARPISWIGRRTIDVARHPDPELVRPIRIAAGALAELVPARDLLVSPDHAMLVDGALIPARLLVNHRSITEDSSAGTVTYYHVELDSHDIILAEGAPAETYLDTGNRGLFANAPVTLMSADLSVAARLRMPQDGACMALTTDAATVFPIWQRLVDRAGTDAATAGPLPAAPDHGIRLAAGARTLRPIVAEGDTLIFALPRDTAAVRLLSAAARPNRACPWLDDRRSLGVAVTDISADHVALALDGPAFGAGWWDLEWAGAGAFRWTNGDATVTVPHGAKLLTIRLHATMPAAQEPIRAQAAQAA